MTAKRWVTAVVLVLGTLAAIFFVRNRMKARANAASAASKESAAAGDRVVPVTAVPVVARDVPVYLEGLGNVSAFYTVTIRSQVDGRLDKVLYTEGQAVKKGDVLMQIDARPFVIVMHQVEAAIARDRAILANSKVNLQRFEELQKGGVGSPQQVADQRAEVAKNTAIVAGDSAQLESARLQWEWTKIVSPIDGVTGVRLVDPGNLVKANDPTGLVVITQLDPIALVFALPQDDLPLISEQMAKGKLVVDAMGRDGLTKLGTGELALVDNQINAATATIKLKAIFPNAERRLWPNQFVKARLTLDTKMGALVVPSTVVQRGPTGTFAYVVGDGDVVAIRPVEVTLTQGDLSIIGKGLKAGERVVSEGQAQLRPGSKVAPKPPAAAPSTSKSSE
ncbi:MAG: efflux RND transporter periplasmic adaptor subunit [Polyangiales bacterium]